MGTIKLMVRNLSSSSLTSSSSSTTTSESAASASAEAAWKWRKMEVEIARAEATSSRIRKFALAIAAIASIAALLVVFVSASKQRSDIAGGRLRHLTISFRGGHYEAKNEDKKSSLRTKNAASSSGGNYAVMHGVCKKDKDCSNPGECCSIHNYCGVGTEYCTKDSNGDNESDKSKQKMMMMKKKKKEKKNDNNDKQNNNNESDKTKQKKMTKKQKKKEKKINLRKSQVAANTSTNDKKKKQDQEKSKGTDNDDGESSFSGCAQGRCCTPREVAQAVMMSSEGSNGRSYCVAAVAVAFGESYDTPNCPGYIDSEASNMSNSDVRGVWQMSQGNGNGSVTDQAKKLWIKYVGNQDQQLTEYDNAYCFNTGSWAIKTPIPGLPSGGPKWLFCTGAFTGTSHGGSDYYSKFNGEADKACAGL